MNTKTEQKEKGLINDGESLVSAKHTISGYPIPIYDDGFGPLWIHRDSLGISGIVRAQSWEDAYGICEDEFFPEASETIEELIKEYGFERRRAKIVLDPVEGEREARDSDYAPTLTLPFVRWETIETPNPDAWSENELFQEAFGFRPNGRRSVGEDGKDRDVIGHGIYAKDLNGDSLDLLTAGMVDELGITLEIESNEIE